MPVSVPRNFSSFKHITGGVDTSSPALYDLRYLGGSWAQRQVFSITLIQAAINSKQLPLALAQGKHAFEILFLASHVIMHKYKHLL